MPLTNTEYSRRRREKIKQDNPEKYKQLRHEENQKYYKKIKEPNEEIKEDELIEDIEYEEKILQPYGLAQAEALKETLRQIIAQRRQSV